MLVANLCQEGGTFERTETREGEVAWRSELVGSLDLCLGMATMFHDGESKGSMRQINGPSGLVGGSWIFASLFKSVIKVALGSAACGACGPVKLP